MRLLMINYEYPPLGGGGGVAAANLARELVRQGQEVDYVTSHFRGLMREETIEGVRIYREPVVGRTGLQTASIVSMLSFPIVAVRRGLRLASQKPYQLIHTHFAIPSGPAGYILSKRLRLPNVLTVYGGDIYDPSKKYSPHRHPVLKFAVKRLLNQASVVVPESQDLCERTAAVYHTRAPIKRIPLGFVSPRYPPVSRDTLGLRPDRLYAIAVSRLVARKSYPDLLRAFKMAGVDNLNLLIIGDGPQEPALKLLAHQLGIQDMVRFLGHVGETEKFQFLSCADFFILASLHEGFGIVFQEAMYCGLPIVTTDTGGQTDFLRHEHNALLAPPQNPEMLAAHITRMCADPQLRRKLSENNRRDIERHSIERVTKQYLHLFEQVLQKKQIGP